MGYFKCADEVYGCIGGVLRLGGADPVIGSRLRAMNLTVQLMYSDPEAYLIARLGKPYDVLDGGRDPHPDVSMSMSSDLAHRYWRGEYDIGVGLASGEVVATGPISKILRLVLATTWLFPLYRQITGESLNLLPTVEKVNLSA